MLLDLFLEVFLHASNAPKSTSQHDVPADRLETIRREVIDNRKHQCSYIGLLILWIAKEDAIIDLISYELQPYFISDSNSYEVARSPYRSIGVLYIVQVLFSYPSEHVHRYFFV